MERSSNAINQKLFLSVGITVLTLSLGLSGCSRGHSRPGSWNNQSLLKMKCNSKKAFSADHVVNDWIDKINTAPDLYVVRTFSIQHNTTTKEVNDAYYSESFAGGLPSEIRPNEYVNSPMVVSFVTHCDDLTADYSGPGINSQFSGKVKGITDKSITIASEDKDKNSQTITVEKVFPDRKGQKLDYLKAKEASDQGLGSLKITIKTKVGNATRTLVMIQKTTLKKDEVIEIDRSVIDDAKALISKGEGIRAQGAAVAPMASANGAEAPKSISVILQTIDEKIKASDAKKVKGNKVKVNFSDLVNLKSAIPMAIQMRAAEIDLATLVKLAPAAAPGPAPAPAQSLTPVYDASAEAKKIPYSPEIDDSLAGTYGHGVDFTKKEAAPVPQPAAAPAPAPASAAASAPKVLDPKAEEENKRIKALLDQAGGGDPNKCLSCYKPKAQVNLDKSAPKIKVPEFKEGEKPLIDSD